ncbi:MAG: hypothetical protein ACREE4_03215 [Stellaceae bacterium]
MADREMIAATLAAGILSNSNIKFGEKTDMGSWAVTLYKSIYDWLDKSERTKKKPVKFVPPAWAAEKSP